MSAARVGLATDNFSIVIEKQSSHVKEQPSSLADGTCSSLTFVSYSSFLSFLLSKALVRKRTRCALASPRPRNVLKARRNTTRIWRQRRAVTASCCHLHLHHCLPQADYAGTKNLSLGPGSQSATLDWRCHHPRVFGLRLTHNGERNPYHIDVGHEVNWCWKGWTV